MDVDIARVARREPGMNAVEIMTSESQERMLAAVRPERADAVREVFCGNSETASDLSGFDLRGQRVLLRLEDDEGRALALDEEGCVYLTGRTQSHDFPTTLGALDRERLRPR